MKIRTIIIGVAVAVIALVAYAVEPQEYVMTHHTVKKVDLATAPDKDELTIHRLTDADYKQIAEELGVEPAAIKAVVEIEAGQAHEGFFEPGKPIINFDLTIFRQFARKNGVNLAKYAQSHSVVFNRPNAKKYGSTQAGQQERLRQAMTIDEKTAIQGTFWGMFQLGGFNWKLCGAEDINDFVEKMSRSEVDQLHLFANFIQNTGLVKHLRNKNWAAFARSYNGPSYAARGYHTKLARSYAKHKRTMK